MLKARKQIFVLCFVFTCLILSTAFAAANSLGPVTSKDVIYQIVTDRLYDGDSSNNIPTGSPSIIFDGTGLDLKLYQGGDFQGIIDKIPYLKAMGVTAVWISAPYQNRDTAIYDYQSGGGLDIWSSFHGYHVSNYFATNKHFGTMSEFISMRDALHQEGIKVIIDFVSNHSSRWQNPTDNFSPEDGKLYEPDKDIYGNYAFDANGELRDYNNDGIVNNLLADPNGTLNANWFHRISDRGTDDSRFGYRYKDLGSLADFTLELPAVIDHLEEAIYFWKDKGIDGIRHDATLHMNPAFTKTFKDAIDSHTGGPVTQFGEFFIGKPDPKYSEYTSFPTRTGINNLDFEFFRTITNVFGNFSENMATLGNMFSYTEADYEYENQTVPFIDNHDVTRFRNIQPNDKPYNAAIAVLMTSRGIPCIYYGTEQYVQGFDDSSTGGRVFMQTHSSFSQTTTAFKMIKKLSDLRQSNDALAYGLTTVLYSDTDVLVYSRKFYDKEVVVAVNRNPNNSYTVPTTATSLPVGTYSDVLTGLLYGSSATVANYSGTNKINSFTLSPGEVCVWSSNPSLGSTPKIGDMVSVMGRPGNTAYIYGTGLDGTVSVKVGSAWATVQSNSYDKITITVPSVSAGLQDVVVYKGADTSNIFKYTVLTDDQVQVIFHVQANTNWGENVYVVGNIPELGSWDPTKVTDAMHCPDYPNWFLPVSVPKGTTVEFKFIKKDSNGNVTWEGGSNRTYTAPTSSTGAADTPTYYWQ